MQEQVETRRVPAEVYSRVVGYMRPVAQWNLGKQEEFRDRRPYGSEQLAQALQAAMV